MSEDANSGPFPGPLPPRYRTLAPIGRGGMAEVLLATTERGKLVVLKRIWADLASDADFVTMFRDEARLAIRLSHPNVVQTHEVVEDAHQLAMAMEYLHGQSLAAIVSRVGRTRELSLALRLRIVIDALAGLHYAHELPDPAGVALGVVHRDVSPENVFVTYDGQVKLMDFGVAQSTAAAHNTRPGVIKGKLTYMAPDYFRKAGIVDRRADVFAVGVMLWELLAGHRLWQGMGEAHIVHHLAAGMPIPNLPSQPWRPPVLDRICARALTIDPADRYATAADLQSDLEGVLAGVADGQPRGLAQLVTRSFSEARAEREALIARALGTQTSARASSPSWATQIDALLPTLDEDLEVTVVDEPVAPRPRQPPPPPTARRGRQLGVAVTTIGLAAVGLALVVAGVKQQQLSTPASAATLLAPAVSVSAPPTAGEVAVPPAAPAEREATAAAVAAAGVGVTAPPRAAPALVRRPVAARRHGDRALDDDAPLDMSPFEELKIDRRRPASVRALDESDPFK